MDTYKLIILEDIGIIMIKLLVILILITLYLDNHLKELFLINKEEVKD
jgi:hypothetical protein